MGRGGTGADMYVRGIKEYGAGVTPGVGGWVGWGGPVNGSRRRHTQSRGAEQRTDWLVVSFVVLVLRSVNGKSAHCVRCSECMLGCSGLRSIRACRTMNTIV